MKAMFSDCGRLEELDLTYLDELTHDVKIIDENGFKIVSESMFGTTSFF